MNTSSIQVVGGPLREVRCRPPSPSSITIWSWLGLFHICSSLPVYAGTGLISITPAGRKKLQARRPLSCSRPGNFSICFVVCETWTRLLKRRIPSTWDRNGKSNNPWNLRRGFSSTGKRARSRKFNLRHHAQVDVTVETRKRIFGNSSSTLLRRTSSASFRSYLAFCYR